MQTIAHPAADNERTAARVADGLCDDALSTRWTRSSQLGKAFALRLECPWRSSERVLAAERLHDAVAETGRDRVEQHEPA